MSINIRTYLTFISKKNELAITVNKSSDKIFLEVCDYEDNQHIVNIEIDEEEIVELEEFFRKVKEL